MKMHDILTLNFQKQSNSFVKHSTTSEQIIERSKNFKTLLSRLDLLIKKKVCYFFSNSCTQNFLPKPIDVLNQVNIFTVQNNALCTKIKEVLGSLSKDVDESRKTLPVNIAVRCEDSSLY